ncbi:MAG: hypothetical protein AB8G15_00960 [Saprospiraceae bacterium]
MKEAKKAWIDAALNSTQGMQRAKPSDELWAKIQANTFSAKVKMIPIQQLRLIAAAAAVLLVMNVMTLRTYFQGENFTGGEPTEEAGETPSLISDYKLYE